MLINPKSRTIRLEVLERFYIRIFYILYVHVYQFKDFILHNKRYKEKVTIFKKWVL